MFTIELNKMSTRRAGHGIIFSSRVKNAEHTQMCTHTHMCSIHEGSYRL